MDDKANIQHNKLMKLENTMLMYVFTMLRH